MRRVFLWTLKAPNGDLIEGIVGLTRNDAWDAVWNRNIRRKRQREGWRAVRVYIVEAERKSNG